MDSLDHHESFKRGIPKSKRHLFVEDRIPRIFQLGGERLMIAEHLGMIDDDDEEGAPGLKILGKLKNVVSLQDTPQFYRCHLGAERTLKALSLGGHGWAGLGCVGTSRVRLRNAQYVRR